jgi:AcrR family transcriptional regulator
VADIETTPRISRREREKLMRRQEIIDAARTLFARKGFNDAKLEDVAELAEFGKGTLYNYFPNKEALFKAVLEDSFETMWEIASGALNADVPFEEKIERFIHGELEYFFKDPTSLYLMMRESHHLRGSNPMMRMLPQLLGLIADMVAAEQKGKTVIPNAEPMDLATILLNMIFGQFTSRIYQTACAGQIKGTEDFDANVKRLFADMTEPRIDQEVTSATKLILTVYFNGITRS